MMDCCGCHVSDHQPRIPLFASCTSPSIQQFVGCCGHPGDLHMVVKAALSALMIGADPVWNLFMPHARGNGAVTVE